MAKTGKFPHTHYHRGKRVKVITRDGEEFIDRFLENKGKFVHTENYSFQKKYIKAMSYYNYNEDANEKPKN